MSSTTSPRAETPAVAHAAWQAARGRLEAEKRRIFEALRSHPTPIPACDVHFNALLAQREAVTQALAGLDALLARHPSGPPVAEVEALLAAVPDVAAQAGHALRSSGSVH